MPTTAPPARCASAQAAAAAGGAAAGGGDGAAQGILLGCGVPLSAEMLGTAGFSQGGALACLEPSLAAMVETRLLATAPAQTAPGSEPDDVTADGGWAFALTVAALATGHCDHRREAAGYAPPASLRHLIEIRDRNCTFPGCRRPARQCDLDHTRAYGKGGRSCECNLAPASNRYSHRLSIQCL